MDDFQKKFFESKKSMANLVNRLKMGIFNNFQRHDKTFNFKAYIKYFQSQIQTGIKLDKNNNYDIQQKRLANVGKGVDGGDAVTKHQMETGLATKQDPTSVLLLDGKIT